MSRKDKAPKRMPMWRKISLALAGTALITAGYCGYAHLQGPGFEKARASVGSRQEHLERICASEPEYEAARQEGIIIGERYNPDNTTLAELVLPLIARTTKNETLIQGGVETVLTTHAPERHRTSAATIEPKIFACFAKMVPQYVIFLERSYSSNYITCDADLRSILRHELQHARDFYHGITYALDGGTLMIDNHALKRGGLDPVFFENIFELRAYHAQLRGLMWREKTDPVSEPHLKRLQWLYLEYHSRVMRPPAQERERRIAALQLRLCDDIRPESDGKDMYLIRDGVRTRMDPQYSESTKTIQQ